MERYRKRTNVQKNVNTTLAIRKKELEKYRTEKLYYTKKTMSIREDQLKECGIHTAL